ncbi:RnfABCDGE type electron transport complex subunit G [Thermatribacter velox]|uniref:Ion-translocating oxidoreductase complex subunit G n=1 Tax=Thermatribacter velox TaxID=3039681 RepID=A0ABZ2YC54_9BACT
MKDILKVASVLALVCVIAAVSLAAVNEVTQKEILRRAQEELKEALGAVFPSADTFQKIEVTLPEEPESKDFSILELYQAFSGDKEVGHVFKVESSGYGGPILLLIGISTVDNTITGIQVLEHQETPGLGSNIAEPEFLGQFVGKSIDDPFKLNQDVKAITGATISSRAMVRACFGVIDYLKGGSSR